MKYINFYWNKTRNYATFTIFQFFEPSSIWSSVNVNTKRKLWPFLYPPLYANVKKFRYGVIWLLIFNFLRNGGIITHVFKNRILAYYATSKMLHPLTFFIDDFLPVWDWKYNNCLKPFDTTVFETRLEIFFPERRTLAQGRKVKYGNPYETYWEWLPDFTTSKWSIRVIVLSFCKIEGPHSNSNFKQRIGVIYYRDKIGPRRGPNATLSSILYDLFSCDWKFSSILQILLIRFGDIFERKKNGNT